MKDSEEGHLIQGQVEVEEEETTTILITGDQTDLVIWVPLHLRQILRIDLEVYLMEIRALPIRMAVPVAVRIDTLIQGAHQVPIAL